MKKLALAVATAAALMLGACGTPASTTSAADSATSAEAADSAASTEEAASTAETVDSAAADSAASTDAATDVAPVDAATALASWTEDSPTVKLVTEYVADVTDPSSPNFIPVEDRIVTIDFDGTLFGELDPIYFDWAIVVHRILWDSTFEPTPEQIEVAHTIEEIEQTRKFPENYDLVHASTLAKIFEGMTSDEIIAYAQEFAETNAPKFTNLKRKDSYYKPMSELVKYLEANDFTCFIVSGTDRTLLRALIPYEYPEIPLAHIIGSPAQWVATGEETEGATVAQLKEKGLEYQLTAEDKVVSSGELEYKDLKMNKVSQIAEEIGKQPVISLGNSSGDSSMANYAVNNNKYKSLALMLCCDDTDRDWGEVDKADKMKKSCEENGWHAVSQKDEWKTFWVGEGAAIDKEWKWTPECEQPGPNARTESADAGATELAAAA